MGANGTSAHQKKRSRRASGGAPNLFDCWDEIPRRVRAAKEIRLFMDFDGTLVSYSPYPESVQLSEKMKAALRRIASHPRMHVGIISGRRRATLQRLVRIRGIEFYGLYGWENGNGFDVSRIASLRLREFLDAIEEHSSEIRGIHAEDKGASVAIHFRDAPLASRRKANHMIHRAVSNSNDELRIVETETAWDVVPSHIEGKGLAVRKLLRGVRSGFLPIFVGDDISDESALKELRRGITVRVGPARRTEARYRLRDSHEVLEFLIRLEKELP
jgi:trehalose 6-phosphate phosphatase